MALDQYYLLGRSGLRVSRLALGPMNFGTGGYHAAYGKTEDEARPIFLGDVADQLGAAMAQVAINWAATQPGIASPIVGASSADQIGTTMAALDFELPAELRAELDQASAVPPESLYRMFTPGYQNQLVSPGVKVGDKPAGYQPRGRNWVTEPAV
jgi:aryl-alcohol dehydrogenase-like predicted oxidoreductase